MTDKPKSVQHSRSQLRRLAQQKGEPMPEFNAAPQADALLRECRETMLTLARGKPVRDLDEQISRIDAHLNAATQPSRISPIVLCNQHGGRGFVRDCIVCNPVGVEQEPVGTATERGELMPKPFMPLHRTIEWSQAEIDKGETVWGLGDIDRGFQNMGMEINRLRAALSRDSEDAERNIDAIVNRIVDAYQDSPKTNYMLALACTQAIRAALAARGRMP